MALTRLLQGFAEFRSGFYAEHRELYERLAKEGQAPKVLVIGCADARVDPAILTRSQPGDLFVIRNVGAIVPPYQPDHQFHGTSSAIEFAVRGLEVEHVVVLGHALCGGLGALIEGKVATEAGYDFLYDWVSIALPAKRSAQRLMPDAEPARLRQVIEQGSVVNTLANLMTFEWLAERIRLGKVAVHGWYFDLTTAQLSALDPHAHRFRAVTDASIPPAALGGKGVLPDAHRCRDPGCPGPHVDLEKFVRNMAAR